MITCINIYSYIFWGFLSGLLVLVAYHIDKKHRGNLGLVKALSPPVGISIFITIIWVYKFNAEQEYENPFERISGVFRYWTSYTICTFLWVSDTVLFLFIASWINSHLNKLNRYWKKELINKTINRFKNY